MNRIRFRVLAFVCVVSLTLSAALPVWGATDAAFAGEGGCFLEVGNGEAMMVRGQFLAEPAPEVIPTEPSRAYLEQKRSFEVERLRGWFA